MCYRCDTKVADHWCDGDCKHWYCNGCWDAIHEGHDQRKDHIKLPVNKGPGDIIKCQDHDVDDTAKHWCEGCKKVVCNNCKQTKHVGADHQTTPETGDVKPLDDEVRRHLILQKYCISCLMIF